MEKEDTIGLLIDTSQEKFIIGLFKNIQIISWNARVHDNHLSKVLIPSLQTLPLNELDYIAVGTGPGSFTGTRIGVAVAKSLSFALNIPLLDFSSPLAFIPDVANQLPHFLYEKFRAQNFHPSREIALTY
jgi:tRNA threonylcarbamoyladenosine biosynthesis protein TsaB